MTNRRRFLQTSAAALGTTALASLTATQFATAAVARTFSTQEPLRKSGASLIRPALAAYSFKSHFAFMKGKPQQPLNDKKIDMFGFVDYCASHRCAAELTSYFFPPDADDQYFLKLKRHAFLNGVPLVGTAIGNNFTIPKGEQLDQQIVDAKLWIDRAALLGAPHVRFFAGTRKQLDADPQNIKTAIESLKICADHAAQRGVFVGVENHGKITAEQLLQIVKEVNNPWVGINLDTGNFISDDPYGDLAKCASQAVNVQLKVKTTNTSGESTKVEMHRINKILNDAGYRGYVVLEFEEADPFEHVPGWMDTLKQKLVSS